MNNRQDAIFGGWMLVLGSMLLSGVTVSVKGCSLEASLVVGAGVGLVMLAICVYMTMLFTALWNDALSERDENEVGEEDDA
jgi:hypothetical protein